MAMTLVEVLNAYKCVGFLLFGGCSGFELTIVHSNDVQAHFEQVNKYGGECSDYDVLREECYGGEPRRVTFINDARRKYTNLLVLDAGDRYSGTLWFNQYHGEAAATFLNREEYDAMCLGTHEFDLGVKFNKTMIKTVGGVKIGIIGVTMEDASFMSKPGPTVQFEDEVETVKTHAKQIKDAGIPIIIVLSHAGYGIDRRMAREVDGVDVIVGGHSHTFLYTGTPLPSVEEPKGPYPTIIIQPSGRTVLVVQAYAWGKYMGLINVTFDSNHEVANWAGDPVLLDKTISSDAATLAVLEQMKITLDRKKQEVVGQTLVRLEGDRKQCRLGECNFGNLLTDSMVNYGRGKGLNADQWTIASIALISGGGIRASIEQGNITVDQVLQVLPFGFSVELIRLYGVHLREACEHSVARYDPFNFQGIFFQVSGIHVTYNLTAPSGSRVVSLEALCLNCKVPLYEAVNSLVYSLLMLDFTIDGGDGFSMIKNNLVHRIKYGWLDTDVLIDYIKKNTPIYDVTEGMIKFTTETQNLCHPVTISATTHVTTPVTIPVTAAPITLDTTPSTTHVTTTVTNPVTAAPTTLDTTPSTTHVTTTVTNPVTAAPITLDTTPSTTHVTTPVINPVTAAPITLATTPATTRVTTPVTNPVTAAPITLDTTPSTTHVTTPVTNPVTAAPITLATTPATTRGTTPVTNPVTAAPITLATTPSTTRVTTPVTNPVTTLSPPLPSHLPPPHQLPMLPLQ